MGSRIPDVIDALVVQADAALSTVTVYDGFGVSKKPGDFLMIGVDDPDTVNPANSADAAQQMATGGTPRSRDETGTITCAALSWNGGRVQKTVRDKAFATVAAVEALLRADPTLGITVPGRLTAQMGSRFSLSQNQYNRGVDALVIFDVAFTARI